MRSINCLTGEGDQNFFADPEQNILNISVNKLAPITLPYYHHRNGNWTTHGREEEIRTNEIELLIKKIIPHLSRDPKKTTVSIPGLFPRIFLSVLYLYRLFVLFIVISLTYSFEYYCSLVKLSFLLVLRTSLTCKIRERFLK